MKHLLLLFIVSFCATTWGMEPEPTAYQTQPESNSDLQLVEQVQALVQKNDMLIQATHGLAQVINQLVEPFSEQNQQNRELTRQNEQLQQDNHNLEFGTEYLQSWHGLAHNPRVLLLCGLFGYSSCIAPRIKKWADTRTHALLKKVGNLLALDGACWCKVPMVVVHAMRGRSKKR